MFAQVACLRCGKPFQVTREKLGTAVTCPWCNEDTDAVPAAVEVNPLPPSEPPLPVARRPRPDPPAPGGRSEGKRRPRWPLLVAYAAGLVLVAGGVFVALRLWPSAPLIDFVPPDGSCSAKLPGGASEQPATPPGEPFTGGTRWVAGGGWGSKVRGEVGWYDLPAADVKLFRDDDLFRMVRERRAEDLGAKADGEAAVRVDAHTGREVRFTGASSRHVERYLFAPAGRQPRVYFVSVGGPNFDPDGETARKVTGSLRVFGAPR